MKATLLSLILLLSFTASTQVSDPLYIYSLGEHYPYQILSYDSLARFDDTVSNPTVLEYGNYGFTNNYIAFGRSYNGNQHYTYQSTSDSVEYSIYIGPLNGSDTSRSITFYKNEKGQDTASREFKYLGGTKLLDEYRQYFYNPNGTIDSLYYRDYINNSLRAEAYSTWHYSSGQLDSVFTEDYYFNTLVINSMNYDANGLLISEDYYVDIGSGYLFYGESQVIRNSSNETVAIVNYLNQNGTLFVEDVWRFYKTNSFSIPKPIINKISVFPNPVISSMCLDYQLESHPENVVFELINMNGCTIKSGIYKECIEVHDLASGTYLLKLAINNHIRSFKIIKAE